MIIKAPDPAFLLPALRPFSIAVALFWLVFGIMFENK
jgi:hypothetical protein